MAKQREGYQSLTMHLPCIVVDRLYADAAAQGVSATQIVIGDYLRKYGIGRDQLPPKPKAGRPVERKGSDGE